MSRVWWCANTPECLDLSETEGGVVGISAIRQRIEQCMTDCAYQVAVSVGNAACTKSVQGLVNGMGKWGITRLNRRSPGQLTFQ